MKNVLINEEYESQTSYTINENGEKTYFLKDVFQQFDKSHHTGRIYREEDYLPIIKIKENNG